MITLYFIAVILFSVGMYQVVCEVMELPSPETVQAMRSASSQDGTRHDGEFDRFVSRIAEKLKWMIHLDSIHKAKLERALRISGKQISPESFILSVILIGMIFFVLFIPVSLLIGDLRFLLLGAALGTALALLQYRKITGTVIARKDRIVAECPRFANYLAQNLSNGNRDLLGMFSAYEKTASHREFAEELNATVADMKTGNYERALLHFQHRVDSPHMTEIIRGLQGVLRGDDQTMYFERVCIDMKQLEISLLKKEAAKRPRKITKYQFFIMAGTILMMAVALVTQLIENLRVLFQ